MTTLEGERTAELDPALLTEARERLAKADSRAGLTLAILGATLTALLGAITVGVIAPGQYAAIPQLLVWSGCAACAPSLVLLGLAVTPRPAAPRPSRAHGADDTAQLKTLLRTASTKYRCIRRATAWGAAFVTLTLAGTLTGMLS
ncbi:hypothetical protein [Streptomyces lomondensis]|uniref:Pycsar effector protein domain-containing protein n=1 Tax=Streptomyces lomondensis TaxID=68229 RepID=A0ABQ2XEE5_9ACTN|nr:hypothetical protein [Streptomyces lomondensis]MCF0077744.1 hypothetical protein [Streptomyces lomondensis]GGX12782.1 hypothetical protein GCM10010383_48460 [Streptomyces lomondensis]